MVLGAVLLTPNSLRTVSGSRAARFVAWIRARSSCVTVRVSCRPYANPLGDQPEDHQRDHHFDEGQPGVVTSRLDPLGRAWRRTTWTPRCFSSTGCRRHLINHHRSVRPFGEKSTSRWSNIHPNHAKTEGPTACLTGALRLLTCMEQVHGWACSYCDIQRAAGTDYMRPQMVGVRCRVTNQPFGSGLCAGSAELWCAP